MHDEAATSAALLPNLPDSRDARVLAYLNLKLRELGQPGVELPAGQ